MDPSGHPLIGGVTKELSNELIEATKIENDSRTQEEGICQISSISMSNKFTLKNEHE
jgi:hypothetical protein